MITFTDWNNATHTESGRTFSLDWSSVSAMQSSKVPFWVYWEAIRQATIERMNVANLSIGNYKTSLGNPYASYRFTDFLLLHSSITNRVTKFYEDTIPYSSSGYAAYISRTSTYANGDFIYYDTTLGNWRYRSYQGKYYDSQSGEIYGPYTGDATFTVLQSGTPSRYLYGPIEEGRLVRIETLQGLENAIETLYDIEFITKSYGSHFTPSASYDGYAIADFAPNVELASIVPSRTAFYNGLDIILVGTYIEKQLIEGEWQFIYESRLLLNALTVFRESINYYSTSAINTAKGLATGEYREGTGLWNSIAVADWEANSWESPLSAYEIYSRAGSTTSGCLSYRVAVRIMQDSKYERDVKALIHFKNYYTYYGSFPSEEGLPIEDTVSLALDLGTIAGGVQADTGYLREIATAPNYPGNPTYIAENWSYRGNLYLLLDYSNGFTFK